VQHQQVRYAAAAGEGRAVRVHEDRGNRPQPAAVKARAVLQPLPDAALEVAQQDRHVVGAGVGDDQVQEAVVVEVAEGDAGRVGAREVAHGGGGEGAGADAHVDQDVVAAAVGDDQVEVAVVV